MPAPRTARRREWVLWPAAAIIIAVVLLHTATGTAPVLGRALGLLFAVVFTLAGTTLLVHRPGNAVSWLVALPSLYFLGEALGALIAPRVSGATLPWVVWAQQVLFAPTVFPVAALLPLLFPTGRPAGRRWRWPVGLGVVGVVLLTVGNGLAPDLLHDLGMDRLPARAANPVAALPEAVTGGLLALGAIAFVVAFVAGVASLVVRTRRASGVERQQLRWFSRAASVSLATWVAAITLEAFGRQDLGGLLFGSGLSLLPAAVAVAILRYRLYDLDRLVSRTIAWSVVSGVLVLVYLSLVLVSQRLVGDRDVPDLVIASSTLLVAALIRPVHRRAQVLVDRRFNRSRLVSEQVVADFAMRLRDEVDRAAVQHALHDAVASSVAPASVRVWLPATVSPTRPR